MCVHESVFGYLSMCRHKHIQTRVSCEYKKNNVNAKNTVAKNGTHHKSA